MGCRYSTNAVVCVTFLGLAGAMALPSCGGDNDNSPSTAGSGGSIAKAGTGAKITGGGQASGASAAVGGVTSVGGARPSGGGGVAGATSCQGVNDNGDCTNFGAGYLCDRTNSTSGDPRICTCTQAARGNLAWTCQHLGTAGTAGQSGRPNPFGQGGSGGVSCVGVEDTAGTTSDCTNFGAGYVCDRTNSTSGDPRICTCVSSATGSLNWSCNHLPRGVAGSTGAGGLPATGGNVAVVGGGGAGTAGHAGATVSGQAGAVTAGQTGGSAVSGQAGTVGHEGATAGQAGAMTSVAGGGMSVAGGESGTAGSGFTELAGGGAGGA